MTKLVYAIDFGTSNSILGAADGTQTLGFAPLNPEAENSDQTSILRSLLYFPDATQVFYGTRAVREFAAHDHTGRFIRSIKKQLPSRSFIGTFVENRPFNLEDLIGLFLGELRKRANSHFGADVTSVVLGRPARFSLDETDDRFAEGRLERAARIAGFKQIEFFPEPVAAAFGYDPADASKSGHASNSMNQEEIVLTADYGGGTSDYTVYRLHGGRFDPGGVIALGGVPIAGDALDAAIMRHRISPWFGTGVKYQVPFGSNVLTMPVHLMERICHPAEISLLRRQDTIEFFRNVKQWSLGPEDDEKMERLFTLLDDQLGFPLFEKIEATKRELSNAPSSTFEFDYPGIKIRERITRKEFERYASPALETIIGSLDETVATAGITPARVDRVLCTGGTARVPWLRQELARRFGAEKLHDLDPFKGVANGLMLRAREIAAES